MKIGEALKQIRQICIPSGGLPVERTTAEELRNFIGKNAEIVFFGENRGKPEEKTLRIAVCEPGEIQRFGGQASNLPENREWIFFTLRKDCSGLLASSRPSFLYAALTYVLDNLLEADVSEVENWTRRLTFSEEKSTFDLFLTQYARSIRNFDREKYVREYARLGFTHIEVNGLAFPHPAEEGVPGEFYPEFYTYCPALDQFVSSRLNLGIYDLDYLQANLTRLKENACLAVKYGLAPGLLCFEPRSVPEAFFQRYPTLRGARVDHPFRSFKPRFSLALAHPVVKKHYQEMLTRLLQEVPELEFLTVWTNDSGAGFEHTKSLYVGRNGGPYLIREWKSDAEIARTAADNVLDFLSLMRDTASRFNPRFRVITRLESFYGEREYLWPGLKNRIDVEAHSLLTQGWESPYSHPLYEGIPVLGSALHSTLAEEEKEPQQELESRGSRCFFFHFFASHGNHEPLLGIPFPWLVYDKLKAFSDEGIRSLAHVGGIEPPDRVPFPVNQQIFREFQMDPDMDIDRAVDKIAHLYAGQEMADDLFQGWKFVDSAVRNSVPLSIYTHYGVVWQRLLVRPLVPDIDAIPEADRAYYEKFMCTSVHNPNRIDLSRDVLFELVSKDYARKASEIFDNHVREPLDSALRLFVSSLERAKKEGHLRACSIFTDQLDRCRALLCLMRTLRNTAVWVDAVREFLGTSDPKLKTECRQKLDGMMEDEIQNCRELLQLWEFSSIEWMIVSGAKETPFIYGDNFPGLVRKKIELMEQYRHRDPWIDSSYMFRLPSDPYAEE